jgi:hypothetical protein
MAPGWTASTSARVDARATSPPISSATRAWTASKSFGSGLLSPRLFPQHSRGEPRRLADPELWKEICTPPPAN